MSDDTIDQILKEAASELVDANAILLSIENKFNDFLANTNLAQISFRQQHIGVTWDFKKRLIHHIARSHSLFVETRIWKIASDPTGCPCCESEKITLYELIVFKYNSSPSNSKTKEHFVRDYVK